RRVRACGGRLALRRGAWLRGAPRRGLVERTKSRRLVLDGRGGGLFFLPLYGRVEHVAVHPVEQRFVLGAPVADRSDHGSAVRSVREAEHLRRYAVHPEHREELLRLLGGAAVVALVLQEQGRSGAAVREGDRRAAPVDVLGLVGRATELADAEVGPDV